MPWLKSSRHFYDSGFNLIGSTATFFVHESYEQLRPKLENQDHSKDMIYLGMVIVTSPAALPAGLVAAFFFGLTAGPVLGAAALHDVCVRKPSLKK
jgi:hypothetical protein